MHPLSTPRYITKRLADNWKLLLSVFVGITVAAMLTSGAPAYVGALGRIGFLASLERSPPLLLNILTSSREVPLERERLAKIEASLEEAFQTHVGAIYTGYDRSLKTETGVMNPTPVLPRPRLALVQEPPDQFGELHGVPSLGHLINLHDLADHVTVLRGRLPGINLDEAGPPSYLSIVEAVVGAEMAQALGIDVDALMFLRSPSNQRTRTLVHVVGVVEATDTGDPYWQDRYALFFGPPAPRALPELEFEIDAERPFASFIVNPEAASKLPNGLVQPSRYSFSLAYVATATGLEEKVAMLDGRLPTDSVTMGPRGPMVEAMVGMPLAGQFQVGVGDVLTLAPYIDETRWVSARIVGVAERADPDDRYWIWGPNGFFSNPDPEAPPQLPVMVTSETFLGAVAEAHPGSFGLLSRYSYVDPSGFEEWSIRESQERFQELVGDLSEILPAQLTSTGIDGLVTGFERRIFLGSVPLLLLITTMVVTVLYFVSMMVSFLVSTRERDVALLKTRGIGAARILRIYGIEGLVMTLVAVAAAPFLAMAAIALSGKLPYFEGVTGGGLLPVELRALPFLVAAGTGVLCLAIFVAPSVLGSRGSMVAHKLRSSRPPSVPFFHRYYLDFGLLVVGGIIFWELQSRGQLVVGGLFGDVEVNETLLVAPVMVLIVVALLFLRFFPLVLMYVSGESPALVHMLAGATLAVLGPGDGGQGAPGREPDGVDRPGGDSGGLRRGVRDEGALRVADPWAGVAAGAVGPGGPVRLRGAAVGPDGGADVRADGPGPGAARLPAVRGLLALLAGLGVHSVVAHGQEPVAVHVAGAAAGAGGGPGDLLLHHRGDAPEAGLGPDPVRRGLGHAGRQEGAAAGRLGADGRLGVGARGGRGLARPSPEGSGRGRLRQPLQAAGRQAEGVLVHLLV